MMTKNQWLTYQHLVTLQLTTMGTPPSRVDATSIEHINVSTQHYHFDLRTNRLWVPDRPFDGTSTSLSSECVRSRNDFILGRNHVAVGFLWADDSNGFDNVQRRSRLLQVLSLKFRPTLLRLWIHRYRQSPYRLLNDGSGRTTSSTGGKVAAGLASFRLTFF
jgi:hypothetical protein